MINYSIDHINYKLLSKHFKNWKIRSVIKKITFKNAHRLKNKLKNQDKNKILCWGQKIHLWKTQRAQNNRKPIKLKCRNVCKIAAKWNQSIRCLILNWFFWWGGWRAMESINLISYYNWICDCTGTYYTFLFGFSV